MKLHIFPNAGGYSLELTGLETARWADRAGHTWPLSQLVGRALSVEVDRNGLSACDALYTVSADELAAIVRDHQPDVIAEFWPRLESKARIARRLAGA